MLSFREFIQEKAEWNRDKDETEIVHHSSEHDFNEFRPLSHFGTKHAARARAYDIGSNEHDSPPEFHHYSVRLKIKKSAEVKDRGEHYPEGIASDLRMGGHISHEEMTAFRKSLKGLPNSQHNQSQLLSLLKSKGIDALHYKNKIEDPGSKSYIITDPKQVRILRKGKSLVNSERGKKKLAMDVKW